MPTDTSTTWTGNQVKQRNRLPCAGCCCCCFHRHCQRDNLSPVRCHLGDWKTNRKYSAGNPRCHLRDVPMVYGGRTAKMLESSLRLLFHWYVACMCYHSRAAVHRTTSRWQQWAVKRGFLRPKPLAGKIRHTAPSLLTGEVAPLSHVLPKLHLKDGALRWRHTSTGPLTCTQQRTRPSHAPKQTDCSGRLCQ